jgi:hypothetical protein
MSLSIQITDSIKTIEQNINSAIADYINDTISKKQNSLLSKAKSLIPNWIASQPEIISLSSNDPTSLIGQFGITGGSTSIINSIVSSVVNSTEISFKKFSSKLSGGLELRFQPSNFTNLLALPEGHTRYQNGDLHWLDWLLFRGDSVIVVDYQYNPSVGLGRSKLGNMIGGGSFRIPPQFSGTKDNNFITRAFTGPQQEKELTDIFNEILK